MKTLKLSLLALLLSGCCTYYNCPPPPPNTAASQYTVVNGTGVDLDVTQDGRPLGTIRTGQVMPVHGALLWQRTVVTVVGRDAAGNYAGTSSWIFLWGTPEAWTVTTLTRPQPY